MERCPENLRFPPPLGGHFLLFQPNPLFKVRTLSKVALQSHLILREAHVKHLCRESTPLPLEETGDNLRLDDLWVFLGYIPRPGTLELALSHPRRPQRSQKTTRRCTLSNPLGRRDPCSNLIQTEESEVFGPLRTDETLKRRR
jgi:hypothetical protein